MNNYKYTNHFSNPQRDNSALGNGLQSIGGVRFEKECQRAQSIISTWNNYCPTPLIRLDDFEQQAQVAKLYYKDESGRFGLGSFKALGGAYAVQCLAQNASQQLVVCTATDGNHGRSVAWGAQLLGVECHIFIHAAVSQSRADSMLSYGAVIHRVDGNYDHSIQACIEMADEHGWQIVSDTSWSGYEDIPRQVMAGYSIMVIEILDQLEGEIPTHIILPAGCGAMAGGVIAAFWKHWHEALPSIIIVESDKSDSVYQSLINNEIKLVNIVDETIMAGLSCGEVSQLAWSVIQKTTSHVITFGDESVAPMMRQLAMPNDQTSRGAIEGGECSTAGLIGLLAICSDSTLAETIEINKQSRILVFGTEGATDKALYNSIIKGVN